jgi:hypothetical protein
MKVSFLASVASLVDMDEPSSVAAVSSRGSGRGAKSGVWSQGNMSSSARQGGLQPGGQHAAGQSKAAAPVLPKELARIQSGLCVAHFNH